MFTATPRRGAKAANAAYCQGGEVFEIANSDLLRGSPIGAIYRY